MGEGTHDSSREAEGTQALPNRGEGEEEGNMFVVIAGKSVVPGEECVCVGESTPTWLPGHFSVQLALTLLRFLRT